MSNNGGAKDHNDMSLPEQQLRWDGDNMDEVPVVQGLLHGGGLRGMEANTNESKGSPTPAPSASGPTQMFGKPGDTLDECH
jgi:hypothetical protein